MKAGPFVPELVRFPVIVQPKWDGWRGVVDSEILYTASLKPIPNEFVQTYFLARYPEAQGLDGELTIGEPNVPDCFNKVDTALKRHYGEPDFVFRVFDWQSGLLWTFEERYQEAMNRVASIDDPRVVMTPNVMVHNMDELMAEEARLVELGYEGAILRDPNGIYKCKRSTAREGYCIKVKRFVDSEAVVIGFEELYSNQNEKQIDERGLTKRQSLSSGLVPMDTLGAFLCRNIYTGVEFKVGSFNGLDLEQRRAIWHDRENYVGRIFTYKYQEIGGYEKPRIPIFKGWRSDVS